MSYVPTKFEVKFFVNTEVLQCDGCGVKAKPPRNVSFDALDSYEAFMGSNYHKKQPAITFHEHREAGKNPKDWSNFSLNAGSGNREKVARHLCPDCSEKLPSLFEGK